MSFILNSGLKIFDLISILNNNPISRLEISKLLHKKGVIADVKAVSKYIKTLKYAGFGIKTKGFDIIKTPFKFVLDENETSGYYLFIKILEKIIYGKQKELLKEKLFGCVELKEIIKPDRVLNYQPVSENSIKLIRMAEKGLDEEVLLPVTIFYQKKKIMNGLIREIRYTTNGVYFLCFDLKKSADIFLDVNCINKIEHTNEPVINFVKEHYKTVFEIKGQLKSNYNLKQGEVITYKKDEVLVTNNAEDKKELLKRILKYGTSCEIIQPKKDKEKLLERLDELEKHFETV